LHNVLIYNNKYAKLLKKLNFFHYISIKN